MIGETLGSYEIIDQIGVGGMGAVFLARHKLIDRKVAIKVLLAEYSNREEAVNRFFNEAKATASLRHPSLVDVIDFGYATDGSAYIVMEYLEGENLGARLRKANRLSVPQTLEFARQIAVGVGVAHAAEIVHRALKPDNVFLVRSPVDPSLEMIKLMDFGIATITSEMAGAIQKTQNGMMLGTPLYMAPEQCRGAGYVDARSDTYAFGCIIFAMLTGRPPFIHEFPGELIAAHLHEPPPRVKSLRPEVPQSLDDLVDQMLSKAPEARPETMAAVTKALGKVASQMGIAATMMLPGVGYMVSSSVRTGERTTSALPAEEVKVAPEPPNQSTRILSSASAAAAFGVSEPKSTTSTTLSAGASEIPAKANGSSTASAPKKSPALPIALAAGVALLAGGYFAFGRKNDVAPAVATVTSAAALTPVAPAPPSAVATKPPEPTAIVPEPAPIAVAPTPAAIPIPTPAAATALVAQPAATVNAAFIFVHIKNGRAGLVATIDGNKITLPVKLPRDGKAHKLHVETPNFHSEDHEIKANRDRVIVLENKPFLFLE